VDAEDALIAALKVKIQHQEALITYVRRRNKRGDARHPSYEPDEGRSNLKPINQEIGRMAIHIGRREILCTLASAAVAWPLAARAQQPPMPIIGRLSQEGSRPATSRSMAWCRR